MARAAEAQGAAGDFAAASATLKSAEALLDKVEDLEHKTAALCAVAKAFHSLDKTADRDRALGAALHLAQSVGDARKRSKALAEVAVKQSALDESAARKTFEAALAAAAEIESPYTRVYALCDVAERYSEAGFPAKAHETLDLAEKAAEKVPQRDTQTQALLKVRALTDRLPKGP